MVELIVLANVGDCMLDQHVLTDANARIDVCSVGFVMMELMERENSIRKPTQISLARPEAWKDESGIKDFLNATKTESLNYLKKVSRLSTHFAELLRDSIISSQGNQIERNSNHTYLLR